MRKLDWTQAQARRYHVSGGTLEIPKTSAQRLALVVRLRRLKADFLRRQEQA